MKKKNRYIEKAGRGMKYSLSLPERIIRSLAALAGGSKVFFERLVGHLRRNGIISGDSKAADFIDVLAAIQEASGNSAVSLDTPPLSREKLSEMVTEMKTDYGRVFLNNLQYYSPFGCPLE